MAANSKSSEVLPNGDDPVGEQDRRRFKPLRAIKRIFKGKKKSKGLSQSMGSMLSPSYDDTPSPANLARSISHESVFAKDGVTTGLPDNSKLRAVLSVGDVSEVPINRLKVILATEETTSASAVSIVTNVDQKVTANETTIAKDKNGNIFPNMNDLTTDTTRLNNKLAYDKISVRPKRRPARNARGAQQTHIIRVEDTPTPVNGFDEDGITDENQERKLRDVSPAPSTKAILIGLQIPPITEDNSAVEPLKRPGKKSPIGAVPTGFVPSLQDVQAFKKRSKRIEESNDPVAPKPIENAIDTIVAKADVVEKPKKSPKSGKKLQKKSGESSSVFSWKSKTKSPASPSKAKSSDVQKDEIKSKGLFSGLKAKKTADKDSKSSSTMSSKLFFQGDKKEQTKKKSVGNEPTKEKKDVVVQNMKTKIDDNNKQEDVTYTKKITTEVEHKVTSPTKESPKAQLSPPVHGRSRPPGGKSLFDEINTEMAKKMKSKVQTKIEQESTAPMHQATPKSVKKHSVEEETSTVKTEDSGDTAAVSPPEVSVPPENSAIRSNADNSAAVSAISASIQNTPVPAARIKKDIDDVSKRESVLHVKEESTPTTEGSSKNTSVFKSPTETTVNSSTVVKLPEAVEPVVNERATSESSLGSSSAAKEFVEAEITPITSSDAENSTVESVSHEEVIVVSTVDANGKMTSTMADHPSEEPPANPSESYSSGTNLEEPISLKTATGSSLSIKEDSDCQISENVDVASPVTKNIPKDVAVSEFPKDDSQADTSKVDPALAEVSVRPSSIVESSNESTFELLSPDAAEESQSVTDLFSKAKLKPVSRNAANRKSASVRISPGEPTPKPLRPRSWNNKDNAADPKTKEESKASLKQAETTSAHQSDLVKKPRLALRQTSPVEIRDKPSKRFEEQSPVKSPDKPRLLKLSQKPSPIKNPERQPLPRKSLDQSSLVKSTDESSTAKKPVPATSPVKSPLAKSPDTPLSGRSMDEDTENNNVFIASEDIKPVARRTNARQKRDDSGKDSGSEPAWIKIARRRSKHWEDGAIRPKSSSNPSPAATESGEERPPSLSAAPKQRSHSSSKAEALSPRNVLASPTRNMQSNRTSCIPAISSNPATKSSPTAKEMPSSGQGKPSWLAIAMQKQKNWGAKEEMV